jgi:hypothetical protein
VYSWFEELNLHVYNSARGLVYDCVIWCLGPLIDDSREYGLFRLYLAAVTYRICRRLLKVED